MVKRKSIVLLMLLLLAFMLYVFRDHVNVRAVSEGDIIITEMMIDPSAVLDSLGEWFEVYNPTSEAINMKNWVICDDGQDYHTILTDLYVQPRDFAVLGINANERTNGEVTCDYQYSNFQMRNVGSDEIVLAFGGALIDEVSYPSGAATTGRSLQLHPDAFYSDWNDVLANWCDSTTRMYLGDYGTPGESNVGCGFSPTPPPPVHDVAIIYLYPAETVICQGSSGNVTVTVQNQGDFAETFNVTVYANTTTVIGAAPVSLPSRGLTVDVVFLWDTTGYSEGNYELIADAETVPNETDTKDNYYIYRWVMIRTIVDLTHDGVVDMQDIAIAARAFGSHPDHPRWDSNADVNQDGEINLKDIALVARHFGETYL